MRACSAVTEAQGSGGQRGRVHRVRFEWQAAGRQFHRGILGKPGRGLDGRARTADAEGQQQPVVDAIGVGQGHAHDAIREQRPLSVRVARGHRGSDVGVGFGFPRQKPGFGLDRNEPVRGRAYREFGHAWLGYQGGMGLHRKTWLATENRRRSALRPL